MAVSIQTQTYTKLGTWSSAGTQTVFSTSGMDAAQSSLLDQYQLNSTVIDPTILPSLQGAPGENLPPGSPFPSNPLPPSIQARADSGAGKSSKIKRSMSTPNVRGQASADAAALSAEKRRNKLGYHRTSVACGHCRRRKIRCIPAQGDTRCSNCIRLKKECNFYPVDQQPEPAGAAGRKSSKVQSVTGRQSESPSPSTSSGNLPDMQSSLPYPHLAMPSIQDLGGPNMKRHRTESFSPETKVISSTRSYEYSNNPTNWMAPNASPVPKSEPSQPYWRPNPQESPVTPAFSPFTPNLQIPPPQNWQPTHPEPSPREEIPWSAPQRSHSYSNIEGLQSQHQYPHYPQPNPPHPGLDPYANKPRMMYGPAIITSTGGHSTIDQSSATTSHHAQSAGPLAQANYPHWQEQYSYPKPLGSTNEPYGPYGATHQGQTQSFGYAEPQAGVYYPPQSQPGR